MLALVPVPVLLPLVLLQVPVLLQVLVLLHGHRPDYLRVRVEGMRREVLACMSGYKIRIRVPV